MDERFHNKILREIKKHKVAYLMIIPAITLYTLFVIYPILWAFIISFKDPTLGEIRSAPMFTFPGKGVGFENYFAVFQDEIFIKAVKNTTFYAIMYIPFTLIVALTLSIYLNKKMRGVNFFRTIVFIPYVISIISASVVFLSIFRTDYGFINNALRSFGFEGVAFLETPGWAMFVVALLGSWRMIGYYMLIFLAGLQSIPKSLYEAADVDGASKKDQFINVTLPGLSKVLSVAIVLITVDVLKVYQEVMVLTGGGPDNSTITIPFLIRAHGFEFFNYGYAAAMSFVFLIIVLSIYATKAIITKFLYKLDQRGAKG